MHLLGNPHLFTYLAEPEYGVIRLKVGLGAFSRRIGTALKSGESVAGMVWQTGRPWVIDDYATWSSASEELGNDGIKALIGTPLRSGPRTLGVIGIASDLKSGRSFGEEEGELLSRFAQLASIALANGTRTRMRDAGLLLYREPFAPKQPTHPSHHKVAVRA